MKVSREQVALNRERIVETAARLFREKGYDGIGVADLMKSAGLTHGGFYGHFASKEDLLAEAAAHALKKSVQRWEGYLAEGRDTALEKISDGYLTRQHCEHPEKGCSVTALGADIARLGPKARHALTEGAIGQMAVLEELMPGADPAARRRQALASYASMVGAIVLARAVDDEQLSAEILQAVQQSLPAGS
ncbi:MULTISPECIES: TetR/AcrR family transcriptional regulator [unclassified Duganella]|uniref:TetR/AcrR family transcriptional regulator n=1 Tax=unclassified Duganella TaxID=2636909 RepID=UPI000E347FC2|nr:MULTISPECIES: TetR/AcrR family transcriptional regulator [unclassified Duganella]RFP16288.1 TetR/AcrR family transcriptional regulator [Duganella sp. BJB475]RFP32550.1 TetR/AcrR family transcriptional regulator [Duganella sp. BJB476]